MPLSSRRVSTIVSNPEASVARAGSGRPRSRLQNTETGTCETKFDPLIVLLL